MGKAQKTPALAVKPAPVPPLPKLVVYDIEQGTDEWYEARRGKVTSSELAPIMAQSEDRAGRTKLLDSLVAEIITGEPRKTFSNRSMERGKEMEPEIIDWYARTRFVDVTHAGFIWNPAVNAGWSPDGLVGDDGAIEVKSTEPHLMVALLKKGTFPTEHRAQVHGGALWVGRRQWVDLIVYAHPKLPKFVARVTPDSVYHRQMADAVETFNWDLEQLVKRIKAMGIA